MAAWRQHHGWKAISRCLALVAGTGIALSAPGQVASATSWATVLRAGSSGEALAQTLPSAPSGPAASCKTATSSAVIVSWAAATHATTYTVYQSTTSATTGFSVAAHGIATTSWTSSALNTGNYWFKVTVTVGSNWASSQSTSTLEATVVKNSSCTII